MPEIPKVLSASGHAIGMRAGPAGGCAPGDHVEQNTTVHVVEHTGARQR